VHCTKISPNFECQGQRPRLMGTKKNKKAWHFVSESSCGVRYSCGSFFGSGPGGTVLGGLAAVYGCGRRGNK